MGNINRKQELAFTLAAIICILFGLLAAENLWWVLLLLWGLMLYYRRKINLNTKIGFRTIDLCLIILGITETVLYFCSTYPANSSHFPLICLTFIFLWFCLNLLVVKNNQKHLILGILTATGGVLALLTMFFFAFFWTKVTDMGFEDITQFRYLYSPMGMLSNDWVSIMLAFLPFATASWFSLPKPYNRFACVACVLISFAVIVSFSRGATICLILFYFLTIILLCYYRIFKFSRLMLGFCLWFIVIVLVCIPIWSPLLTTLAVVENTSQVRSIEGRVQKWKDAGQLFLQYPATGVGSGNFALRSEPLSNQRETVYTGRSINSWLQLASEKGIVGISIYGLLLTVWMIGVFKILRLRKKYSFFAMICSAGVIVCLLRETTFSTIFDVPILFLLIVLMLWLGSSTKLNSNKINIHPSWVTLFIIPIIFFGILQARQKNAMLNCKLFVRAHTKGEDGWEKLQKSLQSSPNNALLHANEGICLLSQMPGYDSLIFLNNHTLDPVLFQAKKSFEKAVALNPADASFHSNLGVLNLAIGDTVNGLKHLKQALILAPHQSIYHLLYGMVSSDESYQRFVHAVYYSPDILDSEWFADLYTQDSLLALSIINDAQVMLSDSFACRKNDYLLQARLAKVLLHQDKINEAEKLLFEVTLAMPNLNRPWMMLGDIAFMRNDTIALQYYERAVQLDPNDAHAKIRIGDWYLDKGRLSKAFGYYIEGIRVSYLFPAEHSNRSRTIYNTYTVSNDVLPPAFYFYIKPYMNIQILADFIAQGYEQEGNISKAILYKQLVNREIKVRELLNK